ncbi:MAG: hypothetical protein ACLPIC_12745 [Rhodoblastus sp.]|uniref:hypothetical protein n=1 Tax=Rhodoblastus sp. TaxID=1962975 RepID=UPI003F96DEBD
MTTLITANELRPPEQFHHAVDEALQRRGVFPMLGAKLGDRRNRLVDMNGNRLRRVLHLRQNNSSKWTKQRDGAITASSPASAASRIKLRRAAKGQLRNLLTPRALSPHARRTRAGRR